QEKVINELKKSQLWIDSAESLTGGEFTVKLDSVRGARQVSRGAVICYDASVQIILLDVPAEIVQIEGTVSEACARELAKNVAKKLEAKIGISFTGVPGPNKVENKPVGTVFIGNYINGLEEVHEFNFTGDREDIRYRSTMKGFELIYNLLTKKIA